MFEDLVEAQTPIGLCYGFERRLLGDAVGEPILAARRGERHQRLEADRGDGLGALAHLGGAPAAVFDHARDQIAGLLFPIDARKCLVERGDHLVLDAVTPRREKAFDGCPSP